MTNSAAIVNLVAPVLAAIATTVLAVFATQQWRVMKENNQAAERQNELVRERWKHEDEIRAEDSEPKAAFGLNLIRDRASIELWCANLGTANFVISEVRISPVDGSASKVVTLDQPVVFAGEKSNIALDEDVLGSTFMGTAEVVLRLQGPRGDTVTDGRSYSLLVIHGNCSQLQPGFALDERVSCPKCAKWVANFSTNGLLTAKVCRDAIAGVKRDFEQTCPRHVSSNVSVKLVSSDVPHS